MREKVEFEIDILDVTRILREKVLVILLCAVIGAGLLGAYSFFVANPVYESTSKIYVLTQSTSITSFADIQVSSSLAKDYEKMITSRPVVRQVKDNLGLDYSYEEIAHEKISIVNPTDTRVLEITCRSNDAQEAADMADEFAVVSKRQIAEIMDTDEPTIFERAVVSSSPIKPDKKKNILLGFALGGVLSALILIIIDIMNNYLRTEMDVERYLKLNVLAAIPLEAPDKKGETK